jgi:hypothetical protein
VLVEGGVPVCGDTVVAEDGVGVAAGGGCGGDVCCGGGCGG